jgi:phage baseplate assembly protein W
MSNNLSDFNSTNRINSNVARTSLYSDLNLAFVINPITKDISPVTDIDAVKNSIKNLVLTNFHERPFNPTMGSGVSALLFEPVNVFTSIAIADAIEKVISAHEPRATDVSVNLIDNADLNEYTVSVEFRVTYNENINEINFFLNRLR